MTPFFAKLFRKVYELNCLLHTFLKYDIYIMSVNTPPNPNVATFNNLYWIIDDAALTTAEANKKYLKFPVAQGAETLKAITVTGLANFNLNTTFSATSNIIQTASSKILQQPATTGYPNPTTNVLNRTDIRTSIGSSTLGSFQIIESVGSHIIEFNANAINNTYDPIVNAGDSVISTVNDGNLVLTNSTGTATNGIRLDSDKLQLGFGGAVDTPTNNITFNTANGVTVNGITTLSSLTPPVSSQTIPIATDSSTKMPTTAWVQSAITAAPAKIPIAASGSANVTYYPTFTTTIGNKTELLIDNDLGPFSYNPSLGEFRVATTLKIRGGTDGQVAIGDNAGLTGQGQYATAIGIQAGNSNQGAQSFALGQNAGYVNLGASAVSIGGNSCLNGSGIGSISIGGEANRVTSGGNYSIAIGFQAGYNSQTAGSICLNASGSALDPNTAGFWVKPVKNDTSVQQALQYNIGTGEITYKAPLTIPYAPRFANYSDYQTGLTGYSKGTKINWAGTWGVNDYVMIRITAQGQWGTTGATGWDYYATTTGSLILRPYWVPVGTWSSKDSNPAYYTINSNNSNIGNVKKAIYYTSATNSGTQDLFYMYGQTSYIELGFIASGLTGGWAYTHLIEYITHSSTGGTITFTNGEGTAPNFTNNTNP
jgi:hypothetical protein